MDAKYDLINGKLYQRTPVINLNKIKNWKEIKKSSWWVYINFQVQGNNRDAKYFSYNFITKNTGDVLSFTLKLIDDKNKEIKFEDKEKKNSNRELFAWTFSMSKSFKNPKKTREQHVEDVLVELEKDLVNFQLTVKKNAKQYKSTLGF